MYNDDYQPPNNALVRREFGAQSMQAVTETSAMAVAAQAKAAVEARYIMAMHRPRSMADVRQRVLRDCRRPSFAEVARYSVPRGRKKNEQTGQWEDNYVEGPSIRMAEAVARAMGNIDTSNTVLYDDDHKLIVRVTATDLESNTSYSKDITIRKIVERSSLRKGQSALATRTNSSGQVVHLVAATDDDIANKQAAAESKAIRTLLLRLVDGDLLDEAMDVCEQTKAAAIKRDPEGERKKVEDGFARLGIMPSDLAEYLGHAVDKCSPAQIQELRNLWTAIKDGATTWRDTIDSVRETRAVNQPETAPVEQPARGTKAAKARAQARQHRDQPPAYEPDPHSDPEPPDDVPPGGLCREPGADG